jgi:phospholipid/cholesterol/gamma-HCH transport system substrate-binding protein
MDEQGYRFGVGVLVVASLVITIILILFFGAAPNFFAKRYDITINFDRAPGVETDTPVRKNGVQIGRVTGVKLLDSKDNDTKNQGVDLTMELDSQYKIRASEVARIGTGSLITGDNVVEFVQSSEEERLKRFDGSGGSPKDGTLDANEQGIANSVLAQGDYIGDGAGKVAPDPLEALLKMQESLAPTLASIEPTFRAVQQASNQVNGLAADIRQVIGGGDGTDEGSGPIEKLAKKAEETMGNLDKTLIAVEGLFNDPKLRLAIGDAAEKLPKLIKEAEGVMSQAKSTIASFEGVGKAAEETMKNVSDFTKPLGAKGDKIVGDALRTMNNLDALLAEIRKVTAKVNSSQGTVQKLLEDDQLYYSFVRTLENVELLTHRMQPIIEDARIFSDKLARDPSQAIGLRGVINGRGAGLGVK